MLSALILSTSLAHAALPPGAESLRRLGTVAQSKEVWEKVGSANWVTSITDAGNGNYIVAWDRCQLPVRVEAIIHPNGPIGPSELKVTPGAPKCRQ